MRRFSSHGDRPTDRPKRRRLLIIRPASSRPRACRRPSIRPSARRPRARAICAHARIPPRVLRVASRRVARRLANHHPHRASPRMRGWVSHLSRVSRARARVHHLARDSAQGNYVSTHPARESTSTTSRARRTNASLDDAAAPPRSGGKRSRADRAGHDRDSGTSHDRRWAPADVGAVNRTKDVVTVGMIFLACGDIDES